MYRRKPIRHNKIIVSNAQFVNKEPTHVKNPILKKPTLRMALLKFFEDNPDVKLSIRQVRKKIGNHMGSRQFERRLKDLADDNILKRIKCECHATNMYSYNNIKLTETIGNYTTTNKTEKTLINAMKKYGELTSPFCVETLKIPTRTAGEALERLFKGGVFSSMYEMRSKNSRLMTYRVYYPRNI
jgi:predicted HTH transcriptional regulator